MKSSVKEEDGGVLINVPLSRVRHGYRIVMVDEMLRRDSPARGCYFQALLAFARARSWKRLLESGNVGSFDEIAELTGKDPSYVRKIMRLNNLSPKFLNALIENRHTDGLSLERMFAVNTPVWREQEEKFGL